MALSWAIAKSKKNKVKEEPYECGIPTTGTNWIQFNVGYYLFALIFLIFDVELVFMYPWALQFRDLARQNPVVLVSMAGFAGSLAVAYVYALKKGALNWKY